MSLCSARRCDLCLSADGKMEAIHGLRFKKVREKDLNFNRLRNYPFHRWDNHMLANQERAHQTRVTCM